MELVNWVREHWDELLAIYAGIVTVASYIVKLIPVLPKDHWALPFVKWLSVWVAVNQPTPKKRPD